MIKSRIIAHRGLSSLAPENTLAAISLAADAGIEWVEIDAIADFRQSWTHTISGGRLSMQQDSLRGLYLVFYLQFGLPSIWKKSCSAHRL